MKKEKIKKYKISQMFMDAYKETGRKSLLVYLILRALIILCMVLQIIEGDLYNAFLCMLSLVLMLLPTIIQRKLDISLPGTLEVIIYLFIFSAEILGEINNFYGAIPHWDTMLHTLNGFLCAAIGFSFVDILNKSDAKIYLSPIYLCLVSFCFSMTVGILWEFFEYSGDKLLLFDMQKDSKISVVSSVTLNPENVNEPIILKDIDRVVIYNKDGNLIQEVTGGYLDIGLNDTMKDLIVNFIGAVVFCMFGFIYLKVGTDKDNLFIDNFVPKKGQRPMPTTVQEKLDQIAKMKEEQKNKKD